MARAALLVAVGLALTGAAAAAPVEKSRVPFRVNKNSNTCQFATLCRLDLVKIPKKKRFEIRHVSCATSGPAPATAAFFQIGVHTGNVVRAEDYYPVGPGVTAGGNGIFVFSAETFQYANAGESVYAVASWVSTVSSFNCTVTGELVTFGKKKKN